ncbi:hypothetical protein MKW94_008046 [Papaver nudicaule]|uniref:Large ribosomal subunit protein eL14 domain-containing protein n=1 Tax=Papaver nudicaule TaxID=74823 RepID=A0AA42AYY6_PAPNU|nr:hypothetical protein [Papaver nudicaule]
MSTYWLPNRTNILALALPKLNLLFLTLMILVIDQNRALVDAPDMERSQMNFKRLSLTDIKIDIGIIPKKKVLIDAMEAAGKLLALFLKKWESRSWGRKLIVQKKRASLNDFDRFKVMLAKIKRGGAFMV